MQKAKVEPKIVHATCVVERSFRRPAGAVFTALSDPDKVRQWMGGGDHSDLLEFGHEFREGGKQVLKYKMKPGTPIAGVVILNEGLFQQIVKDERIVMSSTMKRDGQIFSASQVTFELVATDEGADLILTHQGAFFEGSDGPQMREQGWNSLMDKLGAVLNRE